MCYSADASIQGLVIGLLGSAVLYAKDRPLALFFAYICLMQLFDYVFWKHPPPSTLNAMTTQVALVVNHLQPIVLYYLLKPTHPLATTTIIAYAVVASVYTIAASRQVTYTGVTRESHPSLYWEWTYIRGKEVMYTAYILAFVVLFWLTYDSPTTSLLLIGTLIATFIFSQHTYKREKAVGRMWCHVAAYVPFVLAFVL